MPLRFTPGDYPANPLEKASYRLEFHDEFDEGSLDSEKWLPFHLPQWSSRALSAPNYSLKNGYLILSITRDQQPPGVQSSTVKSGSHTGGKSSPPPVEKECRQSYRWSEGRVAPRPAAESPSPSIGLKLG
jgi:hypothetical protein